MALAGRNATVPAYGRRPLGDPHGPAHGAHSARFAVRLPRHLVALHGFIKKTRATPVEDLALARKRQKELMR